MGRAKSIDHLFQIADLVVAEADILVGIGVIDGSEPVRLVVG